MKNVVDAPLLILEGHALIAEMGLLYVLADLGFSSRIARVRLVLLPVPLASQIWYGPVPSLGQYRATAEWPSPVRSSTVITWLPRVYCTLPAHL